MLKQKFHIDEIAEMCKPKETKVMKKVNKEIKQKDKPINPKDVFSKTPKNTKGGSHYKRSVENKREPKRATIEDMVSYWDFKNEFLS